ncbi:B3 domain-containing transcription repressor VAL1 [Populus alba x Populus x berolinensis]|uniref:B3 domain-containing transcription repressor VAL1 n=1 Tax=Populus alba x Populus x berolinensis TaxID=444605 RepID=A0AAD6LZB3_9ROSI|nr:B3 domain-containing transcription repressor VAL1 [Populus alba x Populus x berolinensis]
MGTKICMNASCQTATTHEWKRGWPLRSGGHALLCYNCGSAYEDSLFCDTFHSEEPGWRECNICSKHLHCGCIASKFLLELLDYGGVGCASCARSSRLHLMQSDEIPNGFGFLARNNAGDSESIPAENTVAGNSNDEGGLAQLCRLLEANEPSLLHPSKRANTNGGLGQFRQEEIMHAIGDIGTGFSNVTQPSIGSPKFSKPDNMSSLLDLRDMHSTLSQPSLSMALGAPSGTTNFVTFPDGAVEGKEQRKIPSFQQGQRSRPILPKPSKPGLSVSSENNIGAASELRIARPPAEGRGKNQLLPRYWPRITDQELQQLSGDLNSNIVPLFEKILSASDAGRIGRLVLPKACAEAYFPPVSQSEGIPLRIQDIKGREWTFQFRFWPNNNSRMYVLEGVTPCIHSMQLKAGDTITFSRIDPGGKLVMGFRKSTNNDEDTKEVQASGLLDGTASGETPFSADGDIGWNNSENHRGRIDGDLLQQTTATTEKKRTQNIGPKSKRLLMHSEDAMELRLTWEEAQDLLHPPPSVKPTIVTIEDHEFEEYDEPPVFGKRTIFTSRLSGGQEQWAQCDDCSKWRNLPVDALLPPKWTCSENAWDSSRCTCSAPEEMTSKDLDNVLRVSKDFKKRRNLGSQKRFQEREPSGLDALATVAVLGDNLNDSGDPSVGATTKHPRHRLGCTCIVCIQPPSGKGKHKPTCTCNVCMTVKRRFKTLMLRKKKRQSEREAEISQKDKMDHKEESEMKGTVSHEVLHINNPDTEGNQCQRQIEKPETSAGQIDLNCHPNREDMPLEIPGLSTMNLVDTAESPLDNYIKQNGLSSFVWDQQGGPAQQSGESLRRLSDEAFLASIGWTHESRRD